MAVSSRGLFGFLARLGRPPAAESDAELLDRFVRSGDEAAFTGIVRRHGPMVLAVCRRRLRRDADAEDAFQAVFLALARSAASIGRGEALPGWLYRVAYLVSLKAVGRQARHPEAALDAAEVPMTDPPTPAWEADELKSVIDSEVAGLGDKFRSVVVLCLVEGRTNAEAAAVLGVPVGTVDSRLSAARKTLQARLTRRGVAVGVGAPLGQVLGGPVSAAEGPRFSELVSHTVRAVLAEAAGPGTGAVSPAVADLARGVTTMTTNVRFLAALGVALAVVGGAGAGLYFAEAADPVPTVSLADPAADPPAAAAKADAQPPAGTLQPEPKGDVKGTAAALDKPFGIRADAGLPMSDLLTQIEENTDLVIRVDVAAFRRLGVFGQGGDAAEAELFLKTIYDTKAVLPRKVEKMPIRDVLADALAQVNVVHPCTYQVRGSQLVIVPAYVPPVRPGVNPLDPGDEDVPLLEAQKLQEQIYGPVVSVAADRKPLTEVLADLRKQTGANIVLDPRCEAAEKKATVTVTLSDVRLYDALRVIADMSELKMVYAGNIYYVTTRSNAAEFQPPTARPMVPGFGALGGPAIPPATPPAVPPEKK